MKKQSVAALIVLLLIPVVMIVGGMLSNLINPEWAAGHPNYVRNFQLLRLLKGLIFFGSVACAVVLWILVCLLVIRSKKRSSMWLLMAPLGPIGLAVLAMLNDRAPVETDRYSRFVGNMNALVRIAYELCTFVILWLLAYPAMVLQRMLMIRYEAATTGVSAAQVMAIQNASSGMWAFAEGNEVLFLVALFYLLRPIVFGLVVETVAKRSLHKEQA